MKSFGMSMTLVVALALSLGLSSSACKKPRKQMLTSEQTKAIDENILTEAPSLQIPINAELDGQG